jgi:putative aldouronate transport system substrate-binding protein
MRKITGFCFALCAGLILAGCGSGSGSGSASSLRVMVWDRGSAYSGTTVADNTTTRFIQDSLLSEKGVTITYMPIPRSGSDEKLNVMVAAGTAPDIIFTYTRAMLDVYMERGGITDLTEAVAAHGENLRTYHKDMLPIGTIDGKQYAIPALRATHFASHTTFIRKDWLDILGEAVPQNKEELYRVLRRFQKEDPGKAGRGLVPWAMGGTRNSEKYFQSFASSFGDITEKSHYIYPQYLRAVQPGAREGYRILNTLYNEGIISKDFALDTNDDKYRRDIMNGNAGFFVEDSTRPYDEGWFAALKSNVPSAEFIPLNVFESPDGSYANLGEFLQGVYIMVPKTAQNKVNAAIQYLDWLADPVHSMQILYTPDYKLDAMGLPETIAQADLIKGKYSSSPGDLSIVGPKLDFMQKKETIVRLWQSHNPDNEIIFDEAHLSNLYDVVNKNLYVDKVSDVTMPMRKKYEASLSNAIMDFAYKIISVAADSFEKTWESEYTKLEQAGLNQVIQENQQYYDSLYHSVNF